MVVRVVVAHVFNPNTWEAGESEFKVSLLYRMSHRAARATSCLEKQNKSKQKKLDFLAGLQRCVQ